MRCPANCCWPAVAARGLPLASTIGCPALSRTGAARPTKGRAAPAARRPAPVARACVPAAADAAPMPPIVWPAKDAIGAAQDGAASAACCPAIPLAAPISGATRPGTIPAMPTAPAAAARTPRCPSFAGCTWSSDGAPIAEPTAFASRVPGSGVSSSPKRLSRCASVNLCPPNMGAMRSCANTAPVASGLPMRVPNGSATMFASPAPPSTAPAAALARTPVFVPGGKSGASFGFQFGSEIAACTASIFAPSAGSFQPPDGAGALAPVRSAQRDRAESQPFRAVPGERGCRDRLPHRRVARAGPPAGGARHRGRWLRPIPGCAG